MKRIKAMWIAGEASGDVLAAELAVELRKCLAEATTIGSPFSQPLFAPIEPYFFGAGGEKMQSNGIKTIVDFTKHSAIGPYDVIKNLKYYKEAFNRLLEVAFSETPDVIICVDFSGFNLRFISRLRKEIKKRCSQFFKFNPLIVQYISPQVWASRPWRVKKIAENFDLLLSIFPFEKEWYKKRAPNLRVEFVGHPLLDRYDKNRVLNSHASSEIRVVLLPGSRVGELKRHVPVMDMAARLIRESIPDVQFSMVLPNDELKSLAAQLISEGAKICLSAGNLQDALAKATLAIASTGTVTMECAYFRVPTVAIYKTSTLTYLIGKKIVTVKHLAMPNIIAGEEVYPEFIQSAATAENIAGAATRIINDKEQINAIKSKLDNVISMLGEPASTRRSAKIISELLISRMPLVWQT
ncbi:MAG: lipid-A-disaccharide synthase [Verrucomicrobiae bacterium]|nr:lipid-A-disaccharide synthase [Verrucomicrobiae bacterium]